MYSRWRAISERISLSNLTWERNFERCSELGMLSTGGHGLSHVAAVACFWATSALLLVLVRRRFDRRFATEIAAWSVCLERKAGDEVVEMKRVLQIGRGSGEIENLKRKWACNVEVANPDVKVLKSMEAGGFDAVIVWDFVEVRELDEKFQLIERLLRSDGFFFCEFQKSSLKTLERLRSRFKEVSSVQIGWQWMRALAKKEIGQKYKAKQVRVRSSSGVVQRVACVCFRVLNNKTEVLLVRRFSKLEWSLPGGGLDPGEEPHEAAIREAEEEAGVRGKLRNRIKKNFEALKSKFDVRVRTIVFIVEVNTTIPDSFWIEALIRERRWFPSRSLDSLLIKQLDKEILQHVFAQENLFTS